MSLRWYQKESIDGVFAYYACNGKGNALVCLPCGSGKTHAMAGLVQRLLKKNPARRILLVCPRQELVSQGYEKMTAYLPFVKVGIVSAGLKRKDYDSQVTVAGIKSIYNSVDELGEQSLLLIDECQAVPKDGDGMYRTLIASLLAKNPNMKVIGYTGTPWRTESGMLTDPGGIFNEIVYDVGIKRLIDEGFLCKLVNKSGKSKADLSKVSVASKGGDYIEKEMERAFNKYDLVESAIAEMERLAVGRKSGIVFCSGKDHAENVAKTLRNRGHTAECVFGDTPPIFRQQHIRSFKEQKIRFLVGCQVFCEGFDAPVTDLIVLLRGTKSPGLLYQMVGRGMRLHEGKENCLVLDFSKSLEELGPIDRLAINKRWNPLTNRQEAQLTLSPSKACPRCDSITSNASRECPDCGYEFVITEIKHGITASSACIISEPEPPIEVEVRDVEYKRHEKANKPPSLRVDYILGKLNDVNIVKVSEWICLEHEGFAGQKARMWWTERKTDDYLKVGSPHYVDDALERVGELKTPKKIAIVREDKYFRVSKVLEWGKSAADEAEESWKKTKVNI